MTGVDCVKGVGCTLFADRNEWKKNVFYRPHIMWEKDDEEEGVIFYIGKRE